MAFSPRPRLKPISGYPTPAPFLQGEESGVIVQRVALSPEAQAFLDAIQRGLQIQSPLTPPPVVVKVMNQQISAETDSAVAFWPEGDSLGVHVVNFMDVPITVQVHAHIDQTRSVRMMEPPIEFDVGSAEHMHQVLSAGRGDAWGPWVWFHIIPNGVPKSGVVTCAFIRKSGYSGAISAVEAAV